MDQEQLKQKIVEYFVKLPKEAQEVFSSMSWMEILQNISAKFSLNAKQVEELGTETTLVLLGITHIDEYKNTLEDGLNLNKESFDNLFKEIEESILNKIKTSLIETYESNTLSLGDEKYGDGKKLEERFSSLPMDVQIAISETNYKETLYLLGQKYKLSIEKTGVLEEITTKVMLNTIHPDEYEENLKNKLGLSEEDNHNLVEDVNNRILKTIKESLRENWDKNGNEDEVPLPPYQIKVESPIIKQEIKMESKPIQEKVPELMPLEIETTPIKKEQQLDIKPITIPSGVNILKDKLLNETTSNNTVSDYSLPKIGNSNPIPSVAKSTSHDPYHEEI